MTTLTPESMIITPGIVDSAVELQRSTGPDEYRRATQAAIAEDTPAFIGFDRSIYAGLCQIRGLDAADSVRRASMLSMNILMNSSDRQHLSPRINEELACTADKISVDGLLKVTYQQKLQTIFKEDYAKFPAVLDLVDKTMDGNPAERFGATLVFGVFASLVNLDHQLLPFPRVLENAPKLSGPRQTQLIRPRRR
jgi:hypothetical protein